MNTQPLVTVAIPAYKSSYLRQAIESVLAQSYRNIELIIVNDRSPEDIGGVVRSFNDERIRYYLNAENVGRANPAHNWNLCVEHAKGEYFALLCDDDLYEPTFVERMMELARKYPHTNVFRARANIIDASGRTVSFYPSAPEWEAMDDYVWHVACNYRYQTISEFVHRTSRLRACGGYALLPLAWYADYLSVYRFSADGGIASCSECLVHFRQSGRNISSQDDKNSREKLLAAKQYIQEVGALLRAHVSEERANLLINLMNDLIARHNKYVLEHAPRLALPAIWRKRKRYGVSSKLLRRAFFHKR